MLKTNYHTHTARCGHAVGTDEEYVQKAIQGGLKTLGFSDHAAYRMPMKSERMDYDQVDGYMASVRHLAETYRSQIKIWLGMEVEYYPDQWEDLSRYRRQLDYCILGQHYLKFTADSCYEVSEPRDLMRYTDLLEEACRHGLCDYICHPDVILYSYPVLDGSVRAAAKRIAEISRKYDMPLELNCGGVKRGMHHYQDGMRYPYPTRIFFEEFAASHCPIIVGLDIHDPDLFLTDEMIHRAMSVTEGLDLNILEDYDLIAAAKKRKKTFF